jgi:uncharacterized protein (DUF1015 family)
LSSIRKKIGRRLRGAILNRPRRLLYRTRAGGAVSAGRTGIPETINEVRPFRAEHYNPEKIENIGMCLSRPYDVISPLEQDEYYRRHPLNVVRLILNRIEKDDTDSNNRYTRARDLLAQWRREQVIVSYRRPSFWVYEQDFQAEGLPRRHLSGFIGLVRLQDYDSGRILPHENVIREPLEDRIRLTRTTHTQFEYIWGIYPDPQHAVDGILATCDRDIQVLDHTEKTTQVRHHLWRLVNPAQCEAISREVARKRIYIADGHHRYQTMLTIRDELRKQHPNAGPDAPWEFIMMYLVSANQEGLTTLGTHRMLRGLPPVSEQTIRDAGKSGFLVRAYSFGEENEIEAREMWLRELRDANPRDHKFGVALQGVNTYYILEIDEKRATRMVEGESGSLTLRLLDVSLLKSIVFKMLLGLAEEQIKPQITVHYTPKVQVALDAVHSGEIQSAWILNHTGLDEIMAVADNREKMPQKSTHFYPKPLSGLVLYDMNSVQ